MKTLNKALKTLVLILACVALPLSFATNSKKSVLITANHHVIELGSYVKTIHKNGPINIYYNQQSDSVYYTWYNAHKQQHVVKAYYRYALHTPNYIGTYYGKLYQANH